MAVRLVKEADDNYLEKAIKDLSSKLTSMRLTNIKSKTQSSQNGSITYIESSIPETTSGKAVLQLRGDGTVVAAMMGTIELNSKNESIIRDFVFEFGESK